MPTGTRRLSGLASRAAPDASPSGSSDWLPNARLPETEEVPAGNLRPWERGTARPSLRGRWRMAILMIALGLLVAVVLRGRRHDTRWFAAWGGSLTAFEPPMVLPQEAERTNSLGMRFVLIPPGAFLMGSADPGDDLQGDERPHRVVITRPFYLAVHEVTAGQFRRFVEATGYVTDAERSDEYKKSQDSFPDLSAGKARLTWSDPGFPQEDNHPVVQVSWSDAQAFLEWLNRIEKREYRLPTEAEWEYACRAGTSTRFSTGEDGHSLRAAANVCNMVDGRTSPSPEPRDAFRFTSPTGIFPHNGFGLHDMHGNASEWCADWYQANGDDLPSKDPQGPNRGDERVVRGGSFALGPWYARSANRSSGPPRYHTYDLGFRVAVTPWWN